MNQTHPRFAHRAGHHDHQRMQVAKAYVMDTSGSMASPGKLDVLKPVLIDLLGTAAHYKQDRIALWSFDSGVRNHVQFTPAGAVGPNWARAVNGLQATGGTAMATALYAVIGGMGAASGFRKSIVLLSDGCPTEPREDVLARIAAARRYKIRINTIAFGAAHEIDTSLLQQLARDTGGTYAHALALKDLARAMRSA